jgi:hypothetical protein
MLSSRPTRESNSDARKRGGGVFDAHDRHLATIVTETGGRAVVGRNEGVVLTGADEKKSEGEERE